MIKQEIIEKISKYFKLTSFEAEKIYDDIFSGIIQGVKEDNIADITNLGEFIIKYNNNDTENKKTVEFLPTLSLEDEINQRSFDEQKQFVPDKITNSEENQPKTEQPVITVTETVNKIIETKSPIEENIISEQELKNTEDAEKLEHDLADEKHNVEDDIKRKRDEILSKITTPKVEQKNTVVPPVVIKPVDEPVSKTIVETKHEITETTEYKEEKPEITENIIEKPKEVEEVTEKSFSDYFKEVSKEEQKYTSQVNKTVIPPVPTVNESTVTPTVENVIPPSAVELHKELTGDNSKVNEYQTTINPLPYANGNGNGNGNGENFEHRLQDNSYYIWYKDSEPNTTDTQTMSYEYELLYQATKEAEYKSKLRIYVTTFIMFFSIVLILLIFSPFIYKYFFTPKEDQNSEEVQKETSTSEQPQNNGQNNQASVNSLETQQPAGNTQNTTEQNNTSTQPVQEQPKQEANQQPKQEQPKQEQPVQQQPKQEQPKQEQPKQQSSGQNIPGITKSSMGWMDDNNRVIYVQLDNGKFTIQESAWDSDAKANKRISAVGALIPGLKGSVLKVDLGSKGTWYRARFGEFSTLEEAKQKAEELRSKEKNRLQALLLTFFWYA